MHDKTTDVLRAGGKRVGHARRRVIEVLEANPGALSADAVAALCPDVHVSSVYRSLSVLEDLGLVRHVHLGHGPALYETTEAAEHTRHLVCERCGRDVQVPSELFDQLRRRVERDYGFLLDAGHFAILGRCRDCGDAGDCGDA